MGRSPLDNNNEPNVDPKYDIACGITAMEIASRQEEEEEQEAKDGGAKAGVGRGITAIAAATYWCHCSCYASVTFTPVLLLLTPVGPRF